MAFPADAVRAKSAVNASRGAVRIVAVMAVETPEGGQIGVRILIDAEQLRTTHEFARRGDRYSCSR